VPLRDSLAGVHLHDNHGDTDEHLPPYEASIDWPTAISYLQTAPNASTLPLTLELKEKTGPDAPSAAELLANASVSLDRFEKAWSAPSKGRPREQEAL
jgi:sugar phosphate isomerase/epimerase